MVSKQTKIVAVLTQTTPEQMVVCFGLFVIVHYFETYTFFRKGDLSEMQIESQHIGV